MVIPNARIIRQAAPVYLDNISVVKVFPVSYGETEQAHSLL